MTLGELIGSLRRSLRRELVRKLSNKTDLTWQQLLTLHVVEGGVQTQAELAERLLVDAPAASRIVASLERDGFLRKLAGSNRRCVCLRVEPKGKRELRTLQKALARLDDEASHLLGRRDFGELMKLLGRLHAGLAARQTAPTERRRGTRERC